MASERTDTGQDKDEDPWCLDLFEAATAEALQSLGIAPTLECIGQSPETKDHWNLFQILQSLNLLLLPHSPLRSDRSHRRSSWLISICYIEGL